MQTTKWFNRKVVKLICNSTSTPLDVEITRVGLFQGNPSPTPEALVSEFTNELVADFPIKTPTAFGPITARNDGRYSFNIDIPAWNNPSEEPTPTFTGFFMYSTTDDTKVLAYGFFEEPVVFFTAETNLQLILRISSVISDGQVEAVVING